MTSKQIARRYLASVKDNPDIDINKMKLRGDAPTDSGIITGKRNVAQSREFATTFSEAFRKEWQEIKCAQIRTFSYRENGFQRACELRSVYEEENFIGNSKLSIAITGVPVSVNDFDYTLGVTHRDRPLFLETYIADPILIGTENFSKKKIISKLIVPGVTQVMAPAQYCDKLKEYKPKQCVTLELGDQIAQIDNFIKNSFQTLGEPYFSESYYSCLILTDRYTIDNWAIKNAEKQEPIDEAIAIRRSFTFNPWFVIGSVLGTGLTALGLITWRKRIAAGCESLKSASCSTKEEKSEEKTYPLSEIKDTENDEVKNSTAKQNAENQSNQEKEKRIEQKTSHAMRMDGQETSSDEKSQFKATSADENHSILEEISSSSEDVESDK
jgi:hypothetical protein